MTRTSDNFVHTASSEQHRFHLLDAIRGIAALLVVAYHAPLDFGRIVPFRSGFLAVDLFFVLSGFVIAFSYEKRLREGYSYRSFVVSRLIRLYPVYLLGTLFAVMVGVLLAHSLLSHGFFPEVLLGLLLLPDVFHGSKIGVYPLDFPAWSLLCELLSNIGYAALVLWRGIGTWLLYLTIAACAVFMVVWVHRSGTVDSGSVLHTFPMGLARVGYSFGAGVLVFRYFNAKPRKQISGSSAWLLAGAICAVVLAALATHVTQSLLSQLLTVLLVFPVLIYFGALTSITGRLSKVTTFLGETSYPIYLFHIPFFTMFRGRSMHQIALHHQQARPIIAFLAFAFLLALSWAAAKWLDLPLRRSLTARYNQRLCYAA